MIKSPLALKIDAWREANPGVRITLAVVRELNDGSDLRYADLSGSNLRGANLSGADLSYSDLSYSNLSGSELRHSNLRGSDLSSVGGITFSAGPSGDGWMIKLKDGRWTDDDGVWALTIGCFEHRTLDDLRDLIEDRKEWPEARGAERERRRPYLRAVLALCEAHIAYKSTTTDL